MTTTPSNSRRARFFERVVFWGFRLATYLIIAAATYIFLDIGIKGRPHDLHQPGAVHQYQVSDRTTADALRV